jgi:hypothetical protein
VRLPLYYGLTRAAAQQVVQAVYDFYGVRRAG